MTNSLSKKNKNIREMLSAAAVSADVFIRDLQLCARAMGISVREAQTMSEAYPEEKEKAALGDRGCREGIIRRFTGALESGEVKPEAAELLDAVDFVRPWKNESSVMFEMLLTITGLPDIFDKYVVETVFTEEKLVEIVKEERQKITARFSENAERLKFIAGMMYAAEYGQDCIDTLQYQDINEIGATRPGYIYVVYKGEKIHLRFLSIETRGRLVNIQKKTTRNAIVGYDEQNPAVTAVKLNSNRITVAGYGLTPSDDDLYYNERIFGLRHISIDELCYKYRTVDRTICEYLRISQAGRGSAFITGADMGVGKSTFMLALMGLVPDKWGIGILDTQNELRAAEKFPAKNIVTLIRIPSRTISECFTTMLKMSRDVLFIGEITTPEEVAELVNAALRLNAGVGATMHSLSPYETVTNIRNLMMRTDMYKDPLTAEYDIARAIDTIINLSRHPAEKGRIIADRIFGVEPFEPYNSILNQEEKEYGAGRSRLSCGYSLRELFRYEPAADRWRVINLPGTRFLAKMSGFISCGELTKLVSLMKEEM
ncbi:MAG: ATPase, T2SS/T4P/T4SS family [Eubacteriales bacterium]|nr:ATPase, T2SS/T4P/T4SS family [Eubacteriales bacterium]